MEEQVRLSRPGVAVPWGFRLQGGADFNQRLVVQRVTADGIAARAQVKLGDVLLKVNGVETLSLTHKQACDLVGAAELHLVLTIVRQHNAHRLWTHDNKESRDSAVIASAAAPPTAATVAADGASQQQQQQQQAWVPSSELVRRASSSLASSPLSPRVPRRAPWDRAPSQSDPFDEAQDASLPPPPPPLVLASAAAVSPPSNNSNKPGSSTASSAAASLLGAQLLRLQLKSPPPPWAENNGTTERGRAPERTATPIPFAPQNAISRGTSSAYVAAPPPAAVAAMTAAARRGSTTRMDESAASDCVDGAERERSTRASSAVSTSATATQASWPQTQQHRRDSGSNVVPGGIQQVRQGPVSPTGTDVSAASVPRGQPPPQETRRNSQSIPENGGTGHRAAYFIQPGGAVTAVQWNDRPLSPDVDKSAVLAALREEQELSQGGGIARRRSSNSNKHGYSFRVLQLITGTADDEDDQVDGDGIVKSSTNASSPTGDDVTSSRAKPESPASPNGSVFLSSSKETGLPGAVAPRRHVSPFQDDYSDF